jgi:hypothetical protein
MPTLIASEIMREMLLNMQYTHSVLILVPGKFRGMIIRQFSLHLDPIRFYIRPNYGHLFMSLLNISVKMSGNCLTGNDLE